MPSLRQPLSIRQKLIALYGDPHVYALGDHVARVVFDSRPGSANYRRNVTCFLLDVEARIANQPAADRPSPQGPRDVGLAK